MLLIRILKILNNTWRENAEEREKPRAKNGFPYFIENLSHRSVNPLKSTYIICHIIQQTIAENAELINQIKENYSHNFTEKHNKKIQEIEGLSHIITQIENYLEQQTFRIDSILLKNIQITHSSYNVSESKNPKSPHQFLLQLKFEHEYKGEYQGQIIVYL